LKENDPFTAFQRTDIVIGNFRFERPRRDADWTITEMSQVRKKLVLQYVGTGTNYKWYFLGFGFRIISRSVKSCVQLKDPNLPWHFVIWIHS
jgi:hypothetical protein